MKLSEFKNIYRPKVETELYAKLFVRPYSYLISYFLVKFTSVSANQLTIFYIFLGLGGAVTFIYSPIAAVIMLQIGYILDCVDGEVARARGTAGEKGEYLDYISHMLVSPAIWMGVGFVAYGNTFNFWYLWLGFGTALFSMRHDYNAALRFLGFRSGVNHVPTLEKRSFNTVRYPVSMNLTTIVVLLEAVKGWEIIQYYLIAQFILAIAARFVKIQSHYYAVEALRD